MNLPLQLPVVGISIVALLPLSAPAQTADDAATACLEAAKLIDEQDFDGALEEARWCVESLQQIQREQTVAAFPNMVDGFVGGPVDNQSAMGMTLLERRYEQDGRSISVSLTTGSAAGGLAAIAQLGMSMGAASGKKLRVQKRTVIDMSEAGVEARYMVQLKSGGILTVESSELSTDEVLDFVKAFPIQTLDDALSP